MKISHFKTLVAVVSLTFVTLGASAASLTLANDRVSATWKTSMGQLLPPLITDAKTGEKLALKGELFTLVLTNGGFIRSSDFYVRSRSMRIEPLPVNLAASRFAERLPGKAFVADLVSNDGKIQATWRGILRDGSRYLRQQLTINAVGADIPLKEIVLLDSPFPNAKFTGSVDGSPVATETVYFGVEHPLSLNRGEMGHVRCFLPRGAVIRKGETFDCTLLAGFVDKGQLRREFLLGYLERERAHPYRPFLHYNSWYDIGYFSKFDEKAALNVIQSYGEELVQKRGVKMDSFLFDDGWDDPQTLWRFDKKNFPNGFSPLRDAAAAIGAGPGIWLSPWGGYGPPHDERIKFGKAQGFEIANGNFSMAGPKYYERFRSLCVDVVQKYGINQFKFDGIGDPNTGLRDFEAMLKLIAELRANRPDIYINQTTGTWPSPFWLIHADSIWRGGEDHEFVSGVAPERERWISYRDQDVFDGIVSKGSLYPLNSLMTHGIIYAKRAHGLNHDTNNVFKSEVRSYFGSGTQLQEMYVTPALLTPENWDTLAEAAKWARANAETLVDVHWVGESPWGRQIYGFAAWSPKKGILTLRNAGSRPAEIRIDPEKVFELPAGAAKVFSVVSPFKDQTVDVTRLEAGRETTFKLKPFEVLVIEALPQAL